MDGILVINKHIGVTSHDIVYKVKKAMNEKVGHTRHTRSNGRRCITITNWKGN